MGPNALTSRLRKCRAAMRTALPAAEWYHVRGQLWHEICSTMREQHRHQWKTEHQVTHSQSNMPAQRCESSILCHCDLIAHCHCGLRKRLRLSAHGAPPLGSQAAGTRGSRWGWSGAAAGVGPCAQQQRAGKRSLGTELREGSSMCVADSSLRCYWVSLIGMRKACARLGHASVVERLSNATHSAARSPGAWGVPAIRTRPLRAGATAAAVELCAPAPGSGFAAAPEQVASQHWSQYGPCSVRVVGVSTEAADGK